MPVEESHQTIRKAFDLEDGMKARRKMLVANLHYLVRLIGCHHPNGGLELSFMKNFDYKTFLKEWETFFDVMHEEHIKAKWYNPFLSRAMYNFIRFLPVKIISAHVYNAFVNSAGTVKPSLVYDKNIEHVLDIDILSCPLVMYDHQREFIETLFEVCPSERLLMIVNAIRSGQRLIAKMREAEDRLYQEYRNLLTRYQDLQKEHINNQAKEASLLNLRYAITTFDALFKIPYAIQGYAPCYLRPHVIPEEELVKAEEFIGLPLSEFEEQLHILSTSKNPLMLLTTMKKFLSHPSDSYNAFVMTEGFKVLTERFAYYTKLKIQDVLKDLTFKPTPSLVEAVRVDQAGLRATIKRLVETKGMAGYDINGEPIDKDDVVLPDTLSLPRRYWIRTLDGEFFVDDHQVNIKEETKDPNTGETTTKERIEHVYNFVRTALGNEVEATLEETTSIFGKTLKEDERRYIDEHAGERGDLGTIGRNSLEDLADKVRRERDERGTAHLGHHHDGNQFEAIQIEAKRWADRVIAQWKEEVDGTRKTVYDGEQRKETPTQETHTGTSESVPDSNGETS